MSEQLRIVFMGTPDFAVATLKNIVASNYKVVGVITAPDKPAGRGRKLQQSAVKKYAEENNDFVGFNRCGTSFCFKSNRKLFDFI